VLIAGWVIAPVAEAEGQSSVTYVALTDLKVSVLQSRGCHIISLHAFPYVQQTRMPSTIKVFAGRLLQA